MQNCTKKKKQRERERPIEKIWKILKKRTREKATRGKNRENVEKEKERWRRELGREKRLGTVRSARG